MGISLKESLKLPLPWRRDISEDDEDDEDDEVDSASEDRRGWLAAKLSLAGAWSPGRLIRWRPGAGQTEDDSPAEPSAETGGPGLSGPPSPQDAELPKIEDISAEGVDEAAALAPRQPEGTVPSGEAPRNEAGGSEAQAGPGETPQESDGDPLGDPLEPATASASLTDASEDEDDEEDKGVDEDSALGDLLDLFNEEGDDGSDIRALALTLEELDVRDVARQCQEVARDLKQRFPAVETS